jgi:hypothetical protein
VISIFSSSGCWPSSTTSAVMSLVIEAIGATRPESCSYSTSPLLASVISAAADLRPGPEEAVVDFPAAFAVRATMSAHSAPAKICFLIPDTDPTPLEPPTCRDGRPIRAAMHACPTCTAHIS